MFLSVLYHQDNLLLSSLSRPTSKVGTLYKLQFLLGSYRAGGSSENCWNTNKLKVIKCVIDAKVTSQSVARIWDQ